MQQYILSIDQGTTSTRAILFSNEGKLITQAQQEFEQHFPKNGWVEHVPEDIWKSTLSVCKQVIKESQLLPHQIKTLGITNQRETTIIWHKETGEPIHNAIVWQDRRTSERCEQIKSQGLSQTITDKTGLIVDPYFSASKIEWLLDNVDGARKLAEQNKLAFGTIDTFLIWHLTGGKQHKTDATNASRTMLYNIHTANWDDELLAIFNIPKNILPKVCDSSADFGEVEVELFDHPIPIQGVAGDQQAALIGQSCFEPGMAKCTYGTGAFLMLNTGDAALKSNNQLLTTIAYQLDGKVHYALEGSIFSAGATVQWLRDKMRVICIFSCIAIA